MSAAWLAEFEEAEGLVGAVRALQAEGYRDLETFTPFPVVEIEDDLVPDHWTPLPAALLAGLVFGLLSYGMQALANAVLYPIDVGGRPLHSWPAFLPGTIAGALLGSALGVLAALLWRCRLPRLYQPLFEAPGFERASTESFFLRLRAAPEDGARIEALLAAERPITLQRLEQGA